MSEYESGSQELSPQDMVEKRLDEQVNMDNLRFCELRREVFYIYRRQQGDNDMDIPLPVELQLEEVVASLLKNDDVVVSLIEYVIPE